MGGHPCRLDFCPPEPHFYVLAKVLVKCAGTVSHYMYIHSEQ